MKPEVLHIMYSIECPKVYIKRVKIHGIFTDKEMKNYRDVRQRLGVEIMAVPLNKFVEEGVEL